MKHDSVGLPALFLDRDGVINIDHGYVHCPEQFEFEKGIFELCRKATALGYRIVVVTNQAGIGRGYYSEADFESLTNWMCEQFLNHDIVIDKVYFCPDHPEHGIGDYKRDSWQRKPNPGMIENAIGDLGIDPKVSVLIGDKESDIEAGRRAGLGMTIYFDNGSGKYSAGLSSPDHKIHNLIEAIPVISHFAANKIKR
jgi:D-glycero-D-manno-heptose 1,7-bisphosphate phosphatase